MKKNILLSLMCIMSVPMFAQKYVDLDLPSGTKWKSVNEDGFFTYDRTVKTYDEKNIPTQDQWLELQSECEWTWTGMGYKIVGPNGKHITLPASGYRECLGSVNYAGSAGFYWASTTSGFGRAMFFNFDAMSVHIDVDLRCYGRSVRLVKNYEESEDGGGTKSDGETE